MPLSDDSAFFDSAEEAGWPDLYKYRATGRDDDLAFAPAAPLEPAPEFADSAQDVTERKVWLGWLADESQPWDAPPRVPEGPVELTDRADQPPRTASGRSRRPPTGRGKRAAPPPKPRRPPTRRIKRPGNVSPTRAHSRPIPDAVEQAKPEQQPGQAESPAEPMSPPGQATPLELEGDGLRLVLRSLAGEVHSLPAPSGDSEPRPGTPVQLTGPDGERYQVTLEQLTLRHGEEVYVLRPAVAAPAEAATKVVEAAPEPEPEPGPAVEAKPAVAAPGGDDPDWVTESDPADTSSAPPPPPPATTAGVIVGDYSGKGVGGTQATLSVWEDGPSLRGALDAGGRSYTLHGLVNRDESGEGAAAVGWLIEDSPTRVCLSFKITSTWKGVELTLTWTDAGGAQRAVIPMGPVDGPGAAPSRRPFRQQDTELFGHWLQYEPAPRIHFQLVGDGTCVVDGNPEGSWWTDSGVLYLWVRDALRLARYARDSDEVTMALPDGSRRGWRRSSG